MEWLVFAAVGVALYKLYERVQRLEARIAELTFEPLAEPPEPVRTVPKVIIRRGEVSVSEPEPEPETESKAEPKPPPETEPEPRPEPEVEAETRQAPAETQSHWEDVQEYERSEYRSPRVSFDFEDVFGRRLPIWAGGIALAIAGIFLVRYSIEAGLITPAIRVALSFVFGLALIAAAEAAYRFEIRVGDERVRQALAGAGLATLFGAFYLAGSAYGLIGAASAFIGLAAVTAASIALSFRFGLACAILGLLGGFAAPVMVESDQANVPLLALYLGLVTTGLAWTARAQGRPWLGYAALAGGLSWGFALLLSDITATGDIIAFGGYLIVLGTALPAFVRSKDGPNLPQLVSGGIATYQIGVLVERAGFEPLTWSLYLLISAALSFLGWQRADVRPGSAIAAAVGVALLAAWPEPDPLVFVLVATTMTALFAGVPLALEWRGKANLFDRLQLALAPLAIGMAAIWQFDRPGDSVFQMGLGAAIAGLAILPACGAALLWNRSDKLEPRTALSLMGSSTILLFAASLLITPSWTTPLFAAAIALGMCHLARSRSEMPMTVMTWAWAVIATAALLLTPDFSGEVVRLWNETSSPNRAQAMLRWFAVLAPFIFLSWLHRGDNARHGSEALGAMLLYGGIAQFVPGTVLAWSAAAGAVAFVLFQRQRQAVWGTFAVITLGWSVPPIIAWLAPAGMSLTGHPMMVGDVIDPWRILRTLVPAILAAGIIGWRVAELPKELRRVATIAAATISIIALHCLYKQIWAIDSIPRFEMFGMAERTIWQAGFVAAAFALLRIFKSASSTVAAWIMLSMSLVHLTIFSLLLHNPLWAPQHVGSVPILNWLTPAYGVALCALALGKRLVPAELSRMRDLADAASMFLIAALALSSLRQFYTGSLLSGTPLGQSEDLLRSLAGILLALSYLWWGARTKQRSWRIGSLVLMLFAVLKVFLVDASGLEGLLRIASFMALGFSLIGIGWVYSRQLSRRPSEAG